MPSVTVPLPGPRAAYLRVYEPLSAFAAEDRTAWRRYAEQALGRAERLRAENHQALVGLLGVPPVPVPADESDDAYVLQLEDQVFVCPVQSRLRAWNAFAEFRDGMPEAVLHSFLPPASVRLTDVSHDLWADKEPGALVRIQTATWAVPLHWFVAFAEEDRELRLDDQARSLLHRTRMSAARRRVGRALRTLRRSIGEIDYVEELEGLGRWLEEFHPRSWVELDYGGLVELMDDEELRQDSSAADVAAALAALAAGDDQAAALVHDTLVDRWGAVRALEQAN
jgi:hypothetical protein